MKEWKKRFSILLCLVMALMMLVPTGALAHSPSGAGEQLQGEGPVRVTTALPMWEGSISPFPAVEELNAEGYWTQLPLYEPIIRFLTIDPVNPQTLYAGTGNSGVFKSTNGGVSWAESSSGMTSTDVYCLAIDPLNFQALYVGTGDGLFKSSNGGASWTASSSGLTNTSVDCLAIDPSNPQTLYACRCNWYDGGVWKSTDGGTNWAASSSGLTTRSVLYLVIDPSNPQTLYAGAGSGVFKSTNGGTSWSSSSSGLISSYDVRCLAIDPSNPKILFAGTGDAGTGGGVGVFKSTNGGTSWSSSSSGLTSSNVRCLAIDPSNPSKLYAGTLRGGVFTSTSGGANWATSSSGLTDNEVQCLAIDPSNPQTLYAGTHYGGVFIWNPAGSASSLTLISPNGGENWGVGTSQPIAWTSTNLSGSVAIALSRNGGSTYTDTLAASVAASAGSFNWTVSGPASSTCRVKVTSLADPSAFDSSDGDFTISSSTPSASLWLEPSTCTVVSPQQDLQLTCQVGGTANINTISFSLLWDPTKLALYTTAPGTSNGVELGSLFSGVSGNLQVSPSSGRVDIAAGVQGGTVNGPGQAVKLHFNVLGGMTQSASITFSTAPSATLLLGDGSEVQPQTAGSLLTVAGSLLWPGDTNNDGAVNILDYGRINLHWNKTGPSRPNGSMQWLGQSCPAGWTPAAAVYADCNGNGAINVADYGGVNLNWGKSHSLSSLPPVLSNQKSETSFAIPPKAEGEAVISESSQLWLEPAAATVLSPQEELSLSLKVGGTANINTASFSLLWDPTKLALHTAFPGSSNGVELGSLFSGLPGNLQVSLSSGRVDIAAGVQGGTFNGPGEVARIHFSVLTGLTGGSAFSLDFSASPPATLLLGDGSELQPQSSGSLLTVQSSLPSSLSLTSPNGGESWGVGSSHAITWTSQEVSGNVKVEINRSYPSGTWDTLFASLPNDGSESWLVTAPASAACRVRISSVSDPAIQDISDGNFAISAIPASPSIAFAPTGFTFSCIQGQSNPSSQTLEVWNNGGGTLNWTASEDAGWLSLAPTSGSSTGEHDTVTVSVDASGLVAGTYIVNITLAAVGADNTPQQIQVTLTVQQALPSSITLASPNGGESWGVGSSHAITWTSHEVSGNVKIEINRSYPSGTWDTLFASLPNDGSEFWLVTAPASATCRVRISSVSNPAIQDISDGNFITTGPPATLVINSILATPNSGVSNWNPVTIQASANRSGSWSGTIHHPSGAQIGTLVGGSGSAYSVLWGPMATQNFCGSGFYAVVQVTADGEMQTAIVSFAIENFQTKALPVSFVDELFQPIASPKAGQAFHVVISIRNNSSGVLSSAFALLTIGNRYIGAKEFPNLQPGQQVSSTVSCGGLAAGSYAGRVYVWVSLGGYALAQPLDFAMTVLP